MVYDILKDIRCAKYRRLLDFLNERCDTFTFMFPKYHCLAVTEDNYEIMSDESHKIGDKFYIEESDALREEKMFSEYMTFPTVLFIVAIVVALSSIACFILAPFYIKGKARGAKTAAQVISVIDFIIGILLIFAFLIITLLFNMASDGFFDSADEFMNAVLGFLIVPTRFGM